MKKNQWLIWLFLLLLSGSTFAQELTPFVVSSSGGFYSNSSGMLSFTTGEMTAVETFVSPVWTLTQGFQQPEDLGTSVAEPSDPQFSFGVYPNPSDGHFTLITETQQQAQFDVRIQSILGIDLLHIDFYHDRMIYTQPVDLSAIAPGVYLLTVSMKEHRSYPGSGLTTKIQIIR